MAANGFRVLAHVKGLAPETVKALAGTEPRVPGFPEWLDVDHPRHSFLTDEIKAAATEFAVADARQIHRTFKTQAEAETARANTKVTFGVETVEVPTATQAKRAAAKEDANDSE